MSRISAEKLTIQQVVPANPEHRMLSQQACNLFLEAVGMRTFEPSENVRVKFGGDIATFVALESSTDELLGTAGLGSNNNVARVEDVATAKPYRRQGIASFLLEKVEDTAALIGYEEIEVYSSKNAVPFYRDNGYANVGEHPTKLAKKLS